MNAAKIHLSPQETELLANTELLLIKDRIIQKMIGLYGDMHELFKKTIIENRDSLPSCISEKGGKSQREIISKVFLL